MQIILGKVPLLNKIHPNKRDKFHIRNDSVIHMAADNKYVFVVAVNN